MLPTFTPPAEEEMLAFGGMRETAVRSSPRLAEQPNAELSQLHCAMDLTSRKVYGSPPGIPIHDKLSLRSLSASEIKSRSVRLGISLGSSNEQVESSILTILNLEQEREMIYLNNSLPPSKDKAESSLVLKRAINICEDLVDDDAEFSGDHADQNETISSIRKTRRKKVLSKRAARRRVWLAIYSKF